MKGKAWNEGKATLIRVKGLFSWFCICRAAVRVAWICLANDPQQISDGGEFGTLAWSCKDVYQQCLVEALVSC